MLTISVRLLFLVSVFAFGLGNQLKRAREQHRLQLSSNSDFRYLASTTDTNYINKVLDNVLIPRVAGTANHEKVFKYIVKELRKLSWQIDVDEFTQRVPIFGDVNFKNIIAASNPQAQRQLVLACHYDSKYFKNALFVGAIDSAVPCAMMLEAAKSLNKELSKKEGDVGLLLIFFDGEEAFREWGPNDSIWGAKHLATKLHKNTTRVNGEVLSELDRMDVMILLDLIGARNPTFLNFFENTQQWFVRLAQIEIDLHRSGLLKNHRVAYFQSARPYGRIEDDHVPFLKRNVPILHLITTPFPPEWHTPKDNRDIIDMDTVYNLSLILKAFISEYLHLFVPAQFAEIMDLTWDFTNETVFWPGLTPFSYTKIVGNEEDRGYWYAMNEFVTAEHGGTHLDAPYHFNKQGWKVSDIPIERLIGPGALIDLSGNEAACLQPAHLEQFVQINGEFANNTIVLVKFGWSQFWNNRTKYLGVDHEGRLNFPGISAKAADWIGNSGTIVGVGVDTASVDPGSTTNFYTHRVLSQKQIFFMENVKILVDLPSTGFTIVALPMKLKEGTGAPLRIVAML